MFYIISNPSEVRIGNQIIWCRSFKQINIFWNVTNIIRKRFDEWYKFWTGFYFQFHFIALLSTSLPVCGNTVYVQAPSLWSSFQLWLVLKHCHRQFYAKSSVSLFLFQETGLLPAVRLKTRFSQKFLNKTQDLFTADGSKE